MRGCNQVVTVWNRFREPDTGRERFYRHVLPVLCRVKTNLRRGEYRSNSGVAGMSNEMLVCVPYCEGYVPYEEWKGLDDDGRRRFFTLHVTDLVAKGEWEIDIDGEEVTETELKRRVGEEIAMASAFSDYTRKGVRGGRVGHLKVGCYYGLRSWL